MDRDQSDDGFLMSDREVESLFDELRWMASESLDGFGLMCSMRSHIHAWNMARG